MNPGPVYDRRSTKDSSAAKTGAVMGGTDAGSGTAGRSGIALVNEGTCTIESGTVKRGDDGTFGNYTVYNKEAGTMIIKGGAVVEPRTGLRPAFNLRAAI